MQLLFALNAANVSGAGAIATDFTGRARRSTTGVDIVGAHVDKPHIGVAMPSATTFHTVSAIPGP
jgi:hypothetical protein